LETKIELLEKISKKIEKCNDCILSQTRNKTVPGKGNINSPIVFIGEGPGEEEDKTGIPFVGRAGKLLSKIFESVELDRNDFYITNIVKCRPPNNRVPTDQEKNKCSKYLYSQLAIIQPKLIVTLGSTSFAYLLDLKKVKMGEVRGNIFEWRGNVKIMSMYHPSYLLRNASRNPGSPKDKTWQDIKKIKELYYKIKEGEQI